MHISKLLIDKILNKLQVMIKSYVFFILSFISVVTHAQDTIIKRTGEVITAKVIEVNIGEISYKRADLLDGPLFVINKDDIQKIKYLNGTIDVFSIAKKVEQVPVYYSAPQVSFIENNKILTDLRRGKYIFHGRSISDSRVLFLAYKQNLLWNDKEIKSHISASKRNKALQYTIGFSGAILGGIGLYGSAISASVNTSGNDASITGMVALASAGVVISSQIISFTCKLKRLKHADKVAEIYNQLSKN